MASLACLIELWADLLVLIINCCIVFTTIWLDILHCSLVLILQTPGWLYLTLRW